MPRMSSTDVENAIMDTEQREAQARMRYDIESLDAMWSRDLMVNSTENLILTKEQFLARLRSGTLHYSSFDRITMRVQVAGGAMVTTGKETIVTDSGPDAGMTLSCSYMNVWISDGGRWKLAARHVTEINKMPKAEA